MGPLTLLHSALGGIRSNLGRTALTLLAVMIGVASVITLMGVGLAAGQNVRNQIEGLGANIVTVSPGRPAEGRAQDLTIETAQALDQVDGITAVVPVASSQASVVAGAKDANANIIGTTSDYFDVTATSVAVGTTFSDFDLSLAHRVAVLGADLAQSLFDQTDPIGQTVVVGTTPCEVIGVLKIKDAMGGGSVNQAVLLPLSRVQRSFTGYGALSQIVLQADSAKQVDQVAALATAAVATQLGVSAAEATFNVATQAQLLSTSSEITSTMTTMLGAISGISLLVAGIGVTNIMLMTVAERTREIGIRKAVGARRPAIWGQFLVEATLLCLAGGLLGVLAALGWSRASIAGIDTIVTGNSVLLAVGISLGIGLFFGAYPAIRASKLTVVQALRHD
ncbi:MAG: ABC transporter permease [Micrococcales bacterium]|nr:ABC transporter permease [Micrococcales bacterium]